MAYHTDSFEALQADLNEIKADPTIPDDTTRQRLTEARHGQGKFRAELLSYFDGECPVTGIRIQAALAASHIKPWRDCNNQERLDPDNGLLLAVHIHALFDQGYITFDEDGILIVSAELPERECMRFGVPSDDADLIQDKGQQRYLEYHRAHIFKHPQQ